MSIKIQMTYNEPRVTYTGTKAHVVHNTMHCAQLVHHFDINMELIEEKMYTI